MEDIEYDDDLILLPSSYQINEYSIMEDFIDSLDIEHKQNRLYNAVRGKGAFRKFKDAIYSNGVESLWYTYRENHFKKIAIEWCNINNITYI